jgi:hypothetical protein
MRADELRRIILERRSTRLQQDGCRCPTGHGSQARARSLVSALSPAFAHYDKRSADGGTGVVSLQVIIHQSDHGPLQGLHVEDDMLAREFCLLIGSLWFALVVIVVGHSTASAQSEYVRKVDGAKRHKEIIFLAHSMGGLVVRAKHLFRRNPCLS